MNWVGNTDVYSGKIKHFSYGSSGRTDKDMHVINENVDSRNVKSRFHYIWMYRLPMMYSTWYFIVRMF
jgi:hypothetical protein